MPPLFHKCSYVHCKTGLPGVLTPVATFLPKPIKGKPVPSYMPRAHAIIGNLRLCESCAMSAKVHELINDKRWSEICRQIEAAGGATPDRASLELALAATKGTPMPEGLKNQLKHTRKAT
jgi:hypothetical protein